MTKNPVLNALAAISYILIIASVMYYGTEHIKPGNSVLAPIAVLSLFTLSAAIMGYVFCYNPAMLFIEGKKKNAVDLFLKTTLVFGGITLSFLLIYFSGILQ